MRSSGILKTSGALLAKARSASDGMRVQPIEDVMKVLIDRLEEIEEYTNGMPCVGCPDCVARLPMGDLGILRTVSAIAQELARPFRDLDEFEDALGIYRRASTWLLDCASLQMASVASTTHSRLRDLRDAETEANADLAQDPPQPCRAMMRYQYVCERVLLRWDVCSDEAVELVRLGDRYLRLALWKQAEKAYAEAAGLLMGMACPDYHQEIPQLARLAPMGLTHSLFAQSRYVEAAEAMLVGIRVFPTFPQLSMNPETLFPTPQEYAEVLAELERLAGQEGEGDETKLQFLLAFQYHTLGRHHQAKEMMGLLNGSVPETTFFLEYYERYSALGGSVPLTDMQRVKSLSEERIREVVKDMMDKEKGVAIANRRYRLKIYSTCFIGYEAVDWLVDHYGLTREKAVEFGNLLMAQRIIFHVVSQQPFADDYFFYHFAAPALQAPPLKCGYVMKRGAIAWFRRWAELRKGSLAYYSSEIASRPSRVIALHEGAGGMKAAGGGEAVCITTAHTAEAGRDHCFQLLLGEEALLFAVETKGQLAAWCNAFAELGCVCK